MPPTPLPPRMPPPDPTPGVARRAPGRRSRASHRGATPGQPSETTAGRALTWILGVVVVAAAAAAAVWWFALRSDPEPEAKIRKTPVVTGGPERIEGSWEIRDPAGSGSFVGYRVQEQFVGALAAQEATGRTSEVTGRLRIEGNRVTEAEVRADLRSLRSDKDRRDNYLKRNGLESEQFPESTFRLTEPITLPTGVRPGRTVTVTAAGEFTLHGVTRPVTIELEGRWDGRKVQVVGRLPITFADYGITPPNIGGFVSVEDRGVMELQLFFTRA